MYHTSHVPAEVQEHRHIIAKTDQRSRCCQLPERYTCCNNRYISIHVACTYHQYWPSLQPPAPPPPPGKGSGWLQKITMYHHPAHPVTTTDDEYDNIDDIRHSLPSFIFQHQHGRKRCYYITSPTCTRMCKKRQVGVTTKSRSSSAALRAGWSYVPQ